MRNKSRTARRLHSRRAVRRAGPQSSPAVLRGKRAALLHARRRARARVAWRATVACASLLILLVPMTAGAMSRAPFAPWKWWHGITDWNWTWDTRPSASGGTSPRSARTSTAKPPPVQGVTSSLGTFTARTGSTPSALGTQTPTSSTFTRPDVVLAPVRCTSYVAPSGTDTNPGTSSAPFGTISHAEAAAGLGDVVCVRGGTYHEKVRLTRSGAKSSPITVSGAPDETAIVDGANLSIGRAEALFHIAGGTDYVTVQNLTIRNSSGRGLENGGSHNRVLDSTITRTRQAGLLTTNLAAAATDNEYAGNDISYAVQGNDCLTPSDPCRITGGWESAVNHYTEGNHPYGHDVYRANDIHDNGGEGITVADYDRVVGNTLHDNFSVDVYLDGTQHATVEKNFVYESEKAKPTGGPSAHRLLAMGIALADERGPRNRDNTIRNNVVVNTSTGLDFWDATPGSGLIDDVIDNNTIVNSSTCGICLDAGAHARTLLRDNLVMVRSGTVTSGTGARGITSEANVFTRDGASDGVRLPGEQTFSFAPKDYRLETASAAAIDKGVVSTATDDAFGTPRPQGAGFDIGAYELP